MLAKMTHEMYNGTTFGSHGLRQEGGSADMPLFDRERRREESTGIQRYQNELHECKRLLEAQAKRQNELEYVNEDLERRLEHEARERLLIESQRAEDERVWRMKHKELQEELESWKQTVQEEVKKREMYEERLRRAEKELYRMHQRKYDIEKAARRDESERIRQESQMAKSIQKERIQPLRRPKDRRLRNNPQTMNPENVRDNRALAVAMDFFGYGGNN